MKTMKYKGYTGTITYCTEDNIYYGKLVGIEDLVSYHSEEGLEWLQNAFIDAVDYYIEYAHTEQDYSSMREVYYDK